MANTYRILHFGDIHYRDESEWDSANVLNEFAAVLPSIRESLGPFDFAFCTGDIAFSGHPDQFAHMMKWIDATFFQDTGLGIAKECMFIVPGNHDVTWSKINPAARLIQDSIRKTNTQDEIANHYNAPESLALLTNRLEAYRTFAAAVTTHGCALDGSWASHFDTRRYKVELEGLSSSWLSGPSDDDGRLVVGQPQLHQLRQHRTNGPFRIALMHHPLASLLECDRADLEIELRRKYDIILRGHLHRTSTRFITDNTQQYIELATGALYSGSRAPNSFNVLEILFEERLLRVRSYVWNEGAWVPDRTTYTPDGCLEVDLSFSLGTKDKDDSSDSSEPPPPDQSEDEGRLVFPTKTEVPLVSLDASSEEPMAESVSGLEKPLTPHTVSLKADARELSAWHGLCDALANAIRANELCCVFVPPGFEVSDVLPALIAFCDEHIHENVFLVRGTGLSTLHDLQRAIEASLGVSITDFVRYCDVRGGGLLVIDGMRSARSIGDVATGEPDDIQRLILMIRDYCPELAIVAFTSDPSTPTTHQIEPLEAPAVADFVRSHSWCDFDFKDVAQIEAVTDATGGIPQQIEHFLELRRVSDFETAIAELRRPGATAHVAPLTDGQRNLLLTAPENNPGLRNLIDILAVLERGEPLREIRSMTTAEKPSAQDVLLLTSMQLATAIRIDSPEHSTSDPGSVVRLRRHAWDFANANMSDERRTEVIALVGRAYFGDRWATDRVKLRRRSRERNARGQDVSRVFANEVFIIEQMFDAAGGDEEALIRLASLALKYCETLRRQDRFGDAYFASRELLPRVERACHLTGDNAVEEEFRLTTARSSRMAGETRVAIELLGDIEDAGEALEFKSRRLDALAALMFCYDSEGRPADTERVASTLMKESSTNSWHNIQAAAIHASLSGDDDEAVKKLTTLEKKARRYKHNVVAENILLDLAYRAVSPGESKKYLEKVRSGDQRMYNYLRATAKYASLTIEHDGASGLSARDIAAIEAGYTFMFSQRMVSLLTTFHAIIWQILETRGQANRQIELLKHSSFVWRLCGDNETELRYLRMVQGQCSPQLATKEGPLRRAVSYIIARLRGIRATEYNG